MAGNSVLTSISNAFADAVDAAAGSVVQVHGHRRAASGVVYSNEVVATLARTLGREDGLHVRQADGTVLDAELAGWDPATSLAVLRVPGLTTVPARPADAPARVGHLAVAIARSWSNAVTASIGTVAIIGGPLATGRRREIEQVIRTTAKMHEGFSGGAFINTEGELVGITTSTSIRGLGVVIPSTIAWKTIASVLEHGKAKRGYLGIAGQPASLPESQQRGESRPSALLVVGVTEGSPAEEAGVLVGDLLLDFDEHAVMSPEDLLDLLMGDRVDRAVPLRVLRGASTVTLSVTPRERPGN
ncbi:MAG TPA: trypsin-like peptidase domain-containing protein [Vicinamibacterales bacterium]|nr:trypsin-like peptidase domain-containing protein [Vicinamibacterales bacterium]